MLVKNLKGEETRTFMRALGLEQFGDKPLHILNELKVINPDVYDYLAQDVLLIIKTCLNENVSLLNKEAYIVTRNTNVGTKQNPKWIKKPQLSIDYKYQYQQILNSDLCQSFKIIEVFDGDEVLFSNGDYALKQEPRNVIKGKPTPVGFFGQLILTNGQVFTEYETIESILLKANPETKKIYESANSRWMYAKFIIRQVLRQVPSKYKLFMAHEIEDKINENYNEENVNPAENKLAGKDVNLNLVSLEQANIAPIVYNDNEAEEQPKPEKEAPKEATKEATKEVKTQLF